ncbi:MAG: IS630 family transposase [Chloroflexota bacterium]|nr:IS630 family transposase [Chloroflexota bacterium]
MAVQATPGDVGIDVANWHWKVVRQFIEDRCGIRLSRSSCLRYLHRLGFVYKRPKKRLLKADEAKRAAFVEQYATLLTEAQVTGAKLFFADEAHSRADGDLRGKWVLKGHPALVDSTCPRWGERASSYSAVCLETGEVEYMELTGTSSSETSAAFLRQLRAHHPEPLIVIWDNGPAHGGNAVREYLATSDNALQVIRLPSHSPDFNADEAIWGWARGEVTANTCLGTKARVQEKMAHFLDGLKDRTGEVQSRCRTKLQALVEATDSLERASPTGSTHVDFTCASVLVTLFNPVVTALTGVLIYLLGRRLGYGRGSPSRSRCSGAPLRRLGPTPRPFSVSRCSASC